jgi:hypothetical protein
MLSNFQGNSPISALEIEKFEATSGLSLPLDYLEFLKRSNGGEGFIGPNSYVILWKLNDLIDLNRSYQVAEYAPGLFVFGSDGGGEAYAFDMRPSLPTIVSIPFVGMDLSVVRFISSTFTGYLDTLSKQ